SSASFIFFLSLHDALPIFFDSRGWRISAPFALGRKKEAIERLLRWIGASERAARRLWSDRLERRHAACLGPPPGLPPKQTEGQSPASTHTPARENAFFLLCLAGVRIVYELHGMVTRNF